MGEFLKGLGASMSFGASEDSQGQLDAARRQAGVYSKYDEEARARGFNSGDEMIQFMRQQQGGSKGTAKTSASARFNPGDAAMLHPKKLLEYVMSQYGKATGQDGY